MQRRTRKSSRLAVIVAIGLMLAACGTRVSTSEQQSQAASSGDLGLPTPSTAPQTDVREPSDAPAAVPSDEPSSSESADPALTAGGGSTDGGGVALPSHAPIRVGVVATSFASFAPIFGVSDDSGDTYAAYKAIFAALNKKGGLSGHPIQAFYDTIDGGSSDAATAASSACAKLATDQKVQVVLSAVVNEAFTSCLEKYKLIQLDITQFAYDVTGMRQHPNFLAPEGMGMDRYMQALFDVETALGKLAKGDRLGVLTEDCPVHRRVLKSVVEPAAKQHGITLVEGTISCYQGFDQIASITSQLQGAALKFRSAGVTKVACMSASEGFCIVIFSKGADTQGYHPGYRLTSNGFPYTNSDYSQAVSMAKSQLSDVSAIGWAGHIDLGPRSPAGAAQAATQKLCRSMDPSIGGHSAETGSVRENYYAFFYAQCDTILLLQRVVASAGLDLSMVPFRSTYLKVAPALTGAGLTTGRFVLSGGRGDGAGYVIPQSIKTSCHCFTADGPARAVS